VKGVLTYYQANKGEVDEYLRIRRERGDKIKEYFQSQPEYTEWLKRFRERVREKGLIRRLAFWRTRTSESRLSEEC
jgi:DNA polymerase I-like protein with 3'-5' exonuclease and polymerase domains